jgi:SAM-dependent methyltransferase
MKNAERWQPSKVLQLGSGRYVPNPRYVTLGSRHIVRLIAGEYARVITGHARGRLLDCGCGDVPYYGMYKDLVSDTLCIDWGPGVHGKEHVDREVDLNQLLPLETGSFDTVLLADVLEHIQVPDQLVRELARVLAPGGKLIMMVPFFYQVHEPPHDYNRYTRFALERMCKEAGLEVVELTPYGGYPDVLLDLFNKGLAKLGPLCHLFLATTAFTVRTSWIDGWRRDTAERFPLGYSVVARKRGPDALP